MWPGGTISKDFCCKSRMHHHHDASLGLQTTWISIQCPMNMQHLVIKNIWLCLGHEVMLVFLLKSPPPVTPDTVFVLLTHITKEEKGEREFVPHVHIRQRRFLCSCSWSGQLEVQNWSAGCLELCAFFLCHGS